MPLDERWLESLVAPLKAGAADATFANQLPRADATALVRRDYLRAFGDGRAAATWPRFFSLASAAARRALAPPPPPLDAEATEDELLRADVRAQVANYDEWACAAATRHASAAPDP